MGEADYFALAGAYHVHQHLTCCFDQRKYLHVELLEEKNKIWLINSGICTVQARLKSGSCLVDFLTQERPHLRGRCTRGAPRRHRRHRSAPLCHGSILCASALGVCGDHSACVGSPCLRRRCRNGVCAVSACGRLGRRCRRAAPLGDR